MQTDSTQRPSDDELKKISRGTVLWVDLDPSKGSEQKKTRPCVVVSSDLHNDRLDTLIVVPISSSKGRPPRPHEVFITASEGGLPEDSLAQPIQIRTIDRKARVMSIKGRLTDSTMGQIGFRLFGVLGGLP